MAINSIDTDIIRALTNHNQYVSGEKLGNRLHLSRNTVWKHICKLRSAGYIIEASPRKGYRLVSSPNIISSESLAASLQTNIIGTEIIVVDSAESTNDLLKQLAKNNINEGLVVTAKYQTQGKGRRGRTWCSNPGGLYFSVLLRPKLPLTEVAKITLLAGITVVEILRSMYGLPAVLKWPNDVLVNGKKICGILVELSADSESVHHVIVGVGINCNQSSDSWPPALCHIATSLATETNNTIDRKQLLEQILAHLEHYYLRFREDKNFLLKLARQYTSLLGKTVQVITNNETYIATAIDISENGALIVQKQDGCRFSLWAADVSIC